MMRQPIHPTGLVLAPSGDILYAPCFVYRDGQRSDDLAGVYALDTRSGDLHWRHEAQGGVPHDDRPQAYGLTSDILCCTIGNGRIGGLRAGDGELLWEQPYSPHPGQPVSVMGGAIYFVMGDWNKNYTLLAFEGTSGKEVWRYTFRGWPDPSNIGPWFVVQRGMCLAVEESAISRLDPQSGNLLWRFPMSESLLQTPAISRDGVIYIGDADEMLAALRADDATVLWRILLNQQITAPPLVNEDVVVVGMNEHVHAVSPSDGALIWRVRLAKDYSDVSLGMNPVAVLDSTLYVLAGTRYAEDNAGQAQAFDTRDGSLLWSSETPWIGYYAELLGIVDELLYIGGIDGGTCVALNRQDGREVWHAKGGEYLVTPEAIFQTVNSRVDALRPADGAPLWTFHL